MFNKNSKDSQNVDEVPGDKAKGSIDNLFNSINGTSRTNGVSPIGLVGEDGKKNPPGFTPNMYYVTDEKNPNDSWYGSLLEAHPDYTGSSNYYTYNKIKSKKIDLETNEKFDISKTYPTFSKDSKYPDTIFSTRDHYLLFNDTSTDYFKHGLHVIDNKTPIRSGKNERESWDGSEEGIPLRLAQHTGTPYENTDPIIFGFEVVIDALSSPLLNGSVEDFIEQFNSISEVGSKKYVLSDFKEQFMKIFKTRGSVFIDQTAADQIKTSIVNKGYPSTAQDSQTNIFQTDRKAYMSYYLKKVAGLELIMESNQPSKKKYLTDYRNDTIRLTFSEDVSSSLGTLAHLYKLLYWSKPNGKNIIPENILRFNCDIIISEVRNLNRVRKFGSGNLEVIKENVSRHIYSLKECQFWFDQPAHENEIDLSQPSKEFDDFVVTMDYKYVTTKFERWVPDETGFGQYAGYDNGAIWKIGNPGSRTTGNTFQPGTLNDNSVPKFFTVGSKNSNTAKKNGVESPVILRTYSYNNNSGNSEKINSDSSNPGAEIVEESEQKSSFEQFKENSKKASKNLANSFKRNVKTEIKGQINTRLALLNNTLDKIRNAAGIGKMREPSNIYKVPYYYEGLSNALGGNISSGFFYDVHNSLRDFAGDAVGDAISGKASKILKGGN